MARSMAGREAFVVAHAHPARAPLVPEIVLHLATEVTPLWHATQAWLDANDLPPPFWAFAWAGGQALARHVLDAPSIVKGRRVVDVACGGGIVALAAARAGAAEVIAVDRDPFAIAAVNVNGATNGLTVRAIARDVADAPFGDAEVILAGDVFYDREAAPRFEAWLRARAAEGRVVLAGDPERIYAPAAGACGVRRVGSRDVETPLELEGKASRRTHVLAFERER